MTLLCWAKTPATLQLSPRHSMAPSPSLEYAGDISAAEAWEQLRTNPKAQLVDVRTVAEWNFVGLPDISSLGRKVHCVEWQSFPSGARNPGFDVTPPELITGIITPAGIFKPKELWAQRLQLGFAD